MDAAYAARYRDLYERHWWWRAREAMLVELLGRLAPPGGFGPILDIGCGDGLFFPQLRRFGEPQGLEADAALVSEAGSALGPIHVGPFDDSFEPGRRFGLVLMLDVLEHLDDDAAALRRVAGLLAPQGVAVLTVPAFRLLWTAHDDFNHHRTRYTADSFRRAAAGTGLAVRRCRYAFHWLFPLKLLVRAKETLRASPAEMAQVPPPGLNRLFHGVCRIERRTWGRIPWPFGTSLVAVCGPRSG